MELLEKPENTPSEKMRRIIALTILVLIISLSAKPASLSDDAKIYLITCTPGNELYSIFGHSAIRVQDQSLGIDLVFNYGTFDFMTPNFYLKFMNGQLDYMLTVTNFNSFSSAYSEENRGVTAHQIALDSQERAQVWEYLVWNAQPENRYYRYDFFFDNCATRIRDIFFRIKSLDTKPFIVQGEKSYRDYLHQYLQESPWTAQGIDLVLGLKADAKASEYSRAFLPDYMDSLFMSTKQAPLIQSSQTILSQTIEKQSSKPTVGPTFFAILVLTIYLAITIVEKKRKKHLVLADRLLFLSTGLVGLLITYLWFFTDHSVTVWNLNILWASPLLLLPALLPVSTIKSKILSYLYRILVLCLAAVIIIGPFSPQYFPAMVYPLALTLLVRIWFYAKLAPIVIPKSYR
jgi:hypothetical protein